ncbi:MAG: hypothetical protein HY537_05245, partial [Deltaproteobacteria bacterium]|nr:hypothetical protein [Deltaproteobacteria bacterium]
VAAELQKDLGLSTHLIEGAKGQFDVKVDGKVVYSKAAEGRFPEPGEVTKILRG